MYTLIKGIITSTGKVKKVYEELSISQESLWRELVQAKPSSKEFVVLLSSEGNFISKGYPISPTLIKPIVL